MIHNYNYFLTIVEEGNLSKAADKLFISHQSLSKYLQQLEDTYGVTLFDRKPKLALTPAGRKLYDYYKQIGLTEMNIAATLEDMKNSESGLLSIGMTQARFRKLIVPLLVEFDKKYPDVKLSVISSDSDKLLQSVLDNEIDFALTGKRLSNQHLEYLPLFEETLYLVISDNLLKKYFPDSYPECVDEFHKGVDIETFVKVPFVLGTRGYPSREIIEEHIQEKGIELICRQEIVQPDVQYMLADKDFAASIIPSMLVSDIYALNRKHGMEARLNIFPIKGIARKNKLSLVYLRGRIFPSYGKYMKKLVKELCEGFASAPMK